MGEEMRLCKVRMIAVVHRTQWARVRFAGSPGTHLPALCAWGQRGCLEGQIGDTCPHLLACRSKSKLEAVLEPCCSAGIL